MSDLSAEFVCLSYLFHEYGYEESDIVDQFMYFTKDGLPPIQINTLKKNYTKLELSAYAVQVDDNVNEFIDRFDWAMKALEMFSKKSKKTK